MKAVALSGDRNGVVKLSTVERNGLLCHRCTCASYLATDLPVQYYTQVGANGCVVFHDSRAKLLAVLLSLSLIAVAGESATPQMSYPTRQALASYLLFAAHDAKASIDSFLSSAGYSPNDRTWS